MKCVIQMFSKKRVQQLSGVDMQVNMLGRTEENLGGTH